MWLQIIESTIMALIDYTLFLRFLDVEIFSWQSIMNKTLFLSKFAVIFFSILSILMFKIWDFFQNFYVSKFNNKIREFTRETWKNFKLFLLKREITWKIVKAWKLVILTKIFLTWFHVNSRDFTRELTWNHASNVKKNHGHSNRREKKFLTFFFRAWFHVKHRDFLKKIFKCVKKSWIDVKNFNASKSREFCVKNDQNFVDVKSRFSVNWRQQTLTNVSSR